MNLNFYESMIEHAEKQDPPTGIYLTTTETRKMCTLIRRQEQALTDSNASLMEQTELAERCRKQAETLEAERDRLMLEFCPDEISAEQLAEWEARQRTVSAENSAKIDSAVASLSDDEVRALDRKVSAPQQHVQAALSEARPLAYLIYGIGNGKYFVKDVKLVKDDDWKIDDGGLGEYWAGNEALGIIAASQQPAAAPSAPPSPLHTDAINALLEVATAAYDALDNSEERANASGGEDAEYIIQGSDFEALSTAMDKIDALPDDEPGITSSGGRRAAWALRGLFSAKPNAAAPAIQQEGAALDGLPPLPLVGHHGLALMADDSQVPAYSHHQMIDYARAALESPVQPAPVADDAPVEARPILADQTDSDFRKCLRAFAMTVAEEGIKEGRGRTMSVASDRCRAVADGVMGWEIGKGLIYDLLMAAQRDLTKPSPAQGDALSQAAQDVLAERQRQVEAEGMERRYDDKYQHGELRRAAAVYAYPSIISRDPVIWPWAQSWMKFTTPRRDAVKAAALLIADIERIDRALNKQEPTA